MSTPVSNRLSVYPLNIKTHRELAAVIERIEADPRSNIYFQPKRRTRHLYVKHVDFRAAAYVKQELLARGGDAVVAKHVIDAKAPYSDILLIGTDGQLNALAQKMEAMDCWGLKPLRKRLCEVLKNTSISGWTLPLPGGRELHLGSDTKIMGILNLTGDSFHASSRVQGIDSLLERAEKMLKDGADVLDIGAESTRPGAAPLDEADELARLIPALKALREAFPAAILSADTYKGKVALAAADAGADIVNDVGGFGLDGSMLACAVRTGLPYVLSHIKGTPSGMQAQPFYDDLLSEMNIYFQEKIEEALAAGLPKELILLDPGLGFGKRTEDNLLILREVETFSSFGCPVLLGHSRKKFTGTVTEASETDDRLQGTTAISALLQGRVQMVRVHDIRENRQALNMSRAIRGA